MLLVRNATVIPGTGVAPFTADIGIVANRTVRTEPGTRVALVSSGADAVGFAGAVTTEAASAVSVMLKTVCVAAS